MIRNGMKRLGPWFTALAVGAALAACSLAGTGEVKQNGTHVVDQAELLSPSMEKEIDKRLAGLEAATTDQVVVVTVSDLKGADITDYTRDLANHWGIGQSGKVKAPNGQYYKDNGVVILIAPNDRQVRIEVGRGLESVITNDTAGAIIRDDILPAFKQGNMPGGVSAGADAVIHMLQVAHGPGAHPEAT